MRYDTIEVTSAMPQCPQIRINNQSPPALSAIEPTPTQAGVRVSLVALNSRTITWLVPYARVPTAKAASAWLVRTVSAAIN